MEKRPTGVTIIGVIVFIVGIFATIVGGLNVIGALFTSDQGLRGAEFSIGLITLLFGIIYLLVAKGLFSGSRLAQLVVGVVTVLWLITHVVAFFTVDLTTTVTVSLIISLLIDLLILAVLFGAKGRTFFAAK